MNLLKNFDQKLDKIEKQRIELQKETKPLIKELRKKYPTKNYEVKYLLNIAENIAENEFFFDFLKIFYNDGYHELEIGTSYSELLKKYQGKSLNSILHPTSFFYLELYDYAEDAKFKLEIELDDDKDTIKYIECITSQIEC